MLNNNKEKELKKILFEIYEGEEERVWDALSKRLVEAKNKIVSRSYRNNLFSKEDVLLIAYGDHIQSQGETRLESLAHFCNTYLSSSFNMIHLLPFFPYSSDDGFSVIDYKQVDPSLGTWSDIEKFKFYLMFDGVFNHISAKSKWFQNWLKGEGDNLFISFKDEDLDEGLQRDMNLVTRPRAHPLLSPFTIKGDLYFLWTTFSRDQIDLDFSKPEVLLAVVDAYLFYFEYHAHLIRVDAVPFFWKELGTTCSHHPKTHLLVKVLRLISDIMDQNFLLITESNVPFSENISYFGNGDDEAHIVYNFTLPPLLAHAFLKEDATWLQRWSPSLESISESTTFLNMLASHDGIGLRGLEGITSESEMLWLCDQVTRKGGLVSYRLKDGEKSPYELNITWSSLLYKESDSLDVNVERFVSSYLAAASLPGIPAIYFSSLFGAFNDIKGVEKSGINRRINRQKFSGDSLESYCVGEKTYHQHVFKKLLSGLKKRKTLAAFMPTASKHDFFISHRVWSFFRCPSEGNIVGVYCNLSGDNIPLDGPLPEMLKEEKILKVFENLEEREYQLKDQRLCFTLAPYQIVWMEFICE